MTLRFAKMHGLGNDFMVVDATRQPFVPDAACIRALADRHFGIGFDQLLLVEASDTADADFRYRIFNADGGEVEQCGNGARCFVRFVREQGLSDRDEIRVVTRAGLITLLCEPDGQVRVDMGVPRFEPADIPFLADTEQVVHAFDLDGETLPLSVVSMGNPHAVLVVGDASQAPVARLGAALESHPSFPARVNVGFLEVVTPSQVRLRVFERGAGETLACGTGACAAVVAGIRRGLLVSPVDVDTRGGRLNIAWAGAGAPVLMSGPARTVFVGELDLSRLQPAPPDFAQEPR